MAKKLFPTLVCCALACLALMGLSACSQGAPDGAPEAEASTEKLVVGYDNSYPPYGFIGDDGKPAASTSTWPRPSATGSAGSWSARPSTGTPRTPS